MEDTLVEFEVAKLSKELEFDIPTWDLFYDIDNDIKKGCNLNRNNHNHNPYLISRPTQSLLQKWLREVHNIDVLSVSVRYTGYLEIDYYTYSIMGEFPVGKQKYKFETYELALEEGLFKALNKIKDAKESL